MFITINKKTIKKLFGAIAIIALLLFVIISNPIEGIMKKVYPLSHRELIFDYSKDFGLDPYLVMAVISTESKFNETAQSHKEAKGLMQITESTFEWVCNKYGLDYTSESIYNPQANIHTGCAYLDFLLKSFNYDIKTALAAYNAGQGNVNKWLDDKKYSADGKALYDIPFKETKNYVETVLKRIKIYKKLY